MRLFETFTINDLNPTGGIFVNHNPNKLKNAKLGPNITTLDKTLGGSPNDMIQIYRGTPDKNSQIAAGDYISTNKQLAKDWAGTGFVIGLKVKKGDILDDITEPGGEEYIYIPNAYKKVSNKLKNESKTMKLSELRQLIREEVRRVINENNTKPTNELFTDLYDTAWQLYGKVRNYAVKNPQKINSNDLNNMISTIIKDRGFKGSKGDFANLPDNSSSKLIKLFTAVLKKGEFKYSNWNPKSDKWQNISVSADDLWY